MKPDEANVTGLFAQQKVQYCIPHYQRPQAWRREKHWEPLWTDIEGKANNWFRGVEPKQHYLGAIVLAKRPKTGVRGIDRYLVIDGQQRLSTLQYVLKALSLVTKELDYRDGSSSIHEELYNTNETMMDRVDVQKHKLWPTFRDRNAHRLIMQSASSEALRDEFQMSFTQAGELYKQIEHPRPLAATWFFYRKIGNWIKDFPDQEAKMVGLEALRKAITLSLQLIILWLEPQDDPQVIFECLNGRGEPLRPTDLIKNFIFMSAETEAICTNSDDLTETSPLFKAWSTFDEPVWMELVSRGRATQTRLEWLIYYCLQAETGQDIDSSRTYEAYQKWASPKSISHISAAEQVEILLRYGTHLQAFIYEDPKHAIGQFGKIAQGLDVTTVTPVALAIANNCDIVTQVQMFDAMASYLVRRETCGLTKKAYNIIFLSLLRELRKGGYTTETLTNYLGSLDGEASLWPDDARFALAITTREIYGSRSSLNLCRLLLAAAATQIGVGHASETQWSPDWAHLHVEHLMPQSWYEHWPLSDGTHTSVDEARNLALVSEDDLAGAARFRLIHQRERLKNTLGNLTILSKQINVQIKHHAWPRKQQEIRSATQLRMNYDIVGEPIWNETKIQERGQRLVNFLTALWPNVPTANNKLPGLLIPP